MAAIVRLWSGREVRALRVAMRLSQREFAGRMGVSERMIQKWESGGEKMHPRPINQDNLDTTLAAADDGAKARFVERVGTFGLLSSASESTADTDEPLLSLPSQQRHPIDGKLMTLVDEGVYLAGRTGEPFHLSAFWIDVYPTTNADYARFLAATGHRPPQHWPSSLAPDGLADHPVVFVTWEDATAYANWSAKTLPTSQQWEKAARGTRGDTYRWGSSMTSAKCNVRESGIRSTTPVDRYHSGASPYGVYDLCGNTWEWCSTPTTPGRHELKGSAWTSPFTRCAPSDWNDADQHMLDDDTGFRCATPAETLRALLNIAT
ncbi:hypothetical protein GCM10027589_09370 [Actinocorallia lasiicapitis]